MDKTTEKKKAVKKKEKIEFRVTVREKNSLKKKAEENGVSLSEYARDAALKKKAVKKPLEDITIITIIAMTRDIVRYVEDRYDLREDQNLKRKVDEIWDLLYLHV